jgi:hypothetical protein
VHGMPPMYSVMENLLLNGWMPVTALPSDVSQISSPFAMPQSFSVVTGFMSAFVREEAREGRGIGSHA